MPKDWSVGLINLIFKKGDLMQCKNYIAITLLNITYKILTTIIRTRFAKYTEERLRQYQHGFRKGKSTIDAMLVLTQIMERCYEYGIDFD